MLMISCPFLTSLSVTGSGLDQMSTLDLGSLLSFNKPQLSSLVIKDLDLYKRNIILALPSFVTLSHLNLDVKYKGDFNLDTIWEEMMSAPTSRMQTLAIGVCSRPFLVYISIQTGLTTLTFSGIDDPTLADYFFDHCLPGLYLTLSTLNIKRAGATNYSWAITVPRAEQLIHCTQLQYLAIPAMAIKTLILQSRSPYKVC